jgi:regulator of PEP synthase PpsR (kinase-PPPase family)
MILDNSDSQIKSCNVYMISDSSGETASVVLRSIESQLSGVKLNDFLCPLVKNNEQIDEIVRLAKENNGIILCTLSDEKLFKYLYSECKKYDILCIEILWRIIKEMANFFQANILRGARPKFDDDSYFDRIEAINYTLQHDDGQSLYTIKDADIILVGVSRSSKSPTSVYLANRGYKVANIPFVSGIELPEELMSLHNKLIIGLSINPDRLLSVRKERMKNLHLDLRSNYVDIVNIIDENKEANLIYIKNNWPIIDVTERSIEEISAMIIQHYNRFKSQFEEKFLL